MDGLFLVGRKGLHLNDLEMMAKEVGRCCHSCQMYLLEQLEDCRDGLDGLVNPRRSVATTYGIQNLLK